MLAWLGSDRLAVLCAGAEDDRAERVSPLRPCHGFLTRVDVANSPARAVADSPVKVTVPILAQLVSSAES
ncbi:MAG TPA: hypothetical protein VF070_15525 [Streptosporangiaceae bacterium]